MAGQLVTDFVVLSFGRIFDARRESWTFKV